MYRKQLLLDAIIQGVFIVPLIFTGLVVLVGFMSYAIIGFMVLLFLTGVIQSISGLYWGLIKRESLRVRYLIFSTTYIILSILGGSIIPNSSIIYSEELLFLWVILLPFCTALWYWAITLGDMRRAERFLTKDQPSYSDILDQ